MPVDYGRLISRTWEIVSRNRVLWLLGVLAAMATLFINLNSEYSSYTQVPLPNALNPNTDFSSYQTGTFMGGNGLLSCLWLLLAFALSFVSAGGEAALIASADHIERTHEPLPFADAWGLGWRKMFPVWALNLILGVLILVVAFIIAIPFVIAFGSAIFGALSGTFDPTSSSSSSNTAGGLALGACACGCLLALVAIPLLIVLLIVREYGMRAIVLENESIGQAMGSGWRLMRANMGPTVVMVVIAIAVAVIMGIITGALGIGASAIATVLNPVSQRGPGAGLQIGVGLLALVMATISLLINGPFNAFTSTLWTLFYRNRRQMPGGELVAAGMMPPGGTPYGTPYGAAPPYNPAGGPPPYTPPAGSPPPYTPPSASPPSYTPPADSPALYNPAGSPPPYTTPADSPPPYTQPGSPPPYTPPASQSPYNPAGSPPAYTPPSTSPPPYNPAGSPPPYTPPGGSLPPYTPPGGTGTVQYGTPPPYTPPGETRPMEPLPPDEQARGPEGGSGT